VSHCGCFATNSYNVLVLGFVVSSGGMFGGALADKLVPVVLGGPVVSSADGTILQFPF
jgi:hypothetical protein